MSNLDYHQMPGPAAGEIAEDDGLPLGKRIDRLEKEMKAAARRLEFEEAAALRDRLLELREIQILRS
jgi:excinuclease ABC subunit B